MELLEKMRNFFASHSKEELKKMIDSLESRKYRDGVKVEDYLEHIDLINNSYAVCLNTIEETKIHNSQIQKAPKKELFFYC